MWDGFVEVGRYISETVARIDLVRLEASGIQATLERDNCGGMGPQFDLQAGVRLCVRTADADAARALLDSSPADASRWVCPDCGGDGEPGFAACWQCGRERA